MVLKRKRGTEWVEASLKSRPSTSTTATATPSAQTAAPARRTYSSASTYAAPSSYPIPPAIPAVSSASAATPAKRARIGEPSLGAATGLSSPGPTSSTPRPLRPSGSASSMFVGLTGEASRPAMRGGTTSTPSPAYGYAYGSGSQPYYGSSSSQPYYASSAPSHYAGSQLHGSSLASTSTSTPYPASAAPPKTTRKKRAAADADADAAPKEKRACRFKPRCPQATMDRLERVRSQRFFLVGRRRRGEELREEFDMTGSTGNIYTVTISEIPTCTCPDFAKGNHCKHILFIFIKVLGVPSNSGVWYQKALLPSEVKRVFEEAPAAPNADVVNPALSAAYTQATGRAGISTPSTSQSGAGAPPKTSSKNKNKIPAEGDDCPICYDSMHVKGIPQDEKSYAALRRAAEKVVWCAQCGNAVHAQCFDEWAGSARKAGRQVSCVWCRAAWAESGGGERAGVGGVGRGGAAAVSRQGGYVNLGNVGGLSRERDTSTYYHGPRRGQRHFGGWNYDD